MESLSPPHDAKQPPSYPNGEHKKPAKVVPETNVHYRECLKNHAAALGGHTVDGCGEFMPAATSDLSVPASLTCAACGCHRNFHRRILLPRRHGRESSPVAAGHDDDNSANEDDEGEHQHANHRYARTRYPPPYYSAPHMLLTLSGSGGGPVPMAGKVTRASLATGRPQGGEQLHRRRPRTKFSAEQKLSMHQLSKKLGWRMPKRDDGTVAEFCRRIGVEKGVFKVWMHNNKQSLAGSSGGTHLSRKTSDVAGHEDEGKTDGSPDKNGTEGMFQLQASSPSSP